MIFKKKKIMFQDFAAFMITTQSGVSSYYCQQTEDLKY